MILKSLRLENIRSYTNQLIEFPEGAVLLSGDIGSGKSTILLAIEFALFGIMRTELSGDSLLRHGKNQGSVELKFEIDKNEYIIKRSLKKSRDAVAQDTGYLITNGKKFEGTPIELKSKIIEILGYPEELVTKSKSLIYRYTVYTPQEEMKQILFEDREARLDTLRKLFGIDKYKAIKENAVIFIREIRKKQSELGIKLESETDYLKDKNEKSARISIISEEGKKINEELDAVSKKLVAEKKKLDDTEKKVKEINEIKNRFNIAETKIFSKISDKEKNIKKTEELKAELTKLEEKLSPYSEVKELKPENELEEELNQLATIAEKIFSIEEQLKDKEPANLSESLAKKKEFEEKLSELEVSIAKKSNYEALLDEHKEKEKKALIGLEKANHIIEETDKRINSIGSLEICPTCDQKVDEVHREELVKKEEEKIKKIKEDKGKYDDAINKITSNIEKIKQNLSKIRESEELYKKKREEFIKLGEYLRQQEIKQKEHSALTEKKKNIDELLEKKGIEKGNLLQSIDLKKKQLTKVRENNLKFREKKTLLEKIEQNKELVHTLSKDNEAIDNEIKILSEEKKVLETALRDLKDIDKNYQEQKAAFEAEKEKQKQLEIKVASINHEKSILEKTIKEIELKLGSLEKIRSMIKQLSEIEVWFDEFFMSLMTTMEKHIMHSIHKEFETLLKEWFSILIEEIDISLEEDFSVKIIQDGYETDVENLSGGEKTSVALAYRLALNKVINDLITNIKTKELIILDEPTDGFSSEQLDKVRDILKELSMKQTIIVSHEAKMESYVEAVIKIIKTDNVSMIEKV
jgi:DNA repair protein SbcC/Rad50